MLNLQTLGERIRERRKAQGLTQEELGKEVGVSAQAVSKWETGEAAPDLSLLPSLCATLGVSADRLLGIESIGLEALEETMSAMRLLIEPSVWPVSQLFLTGAKKLEAVSNRLGDVAAAQKAIDTLIEAGLVVRGEVPCSKSTAPSIVEMPPANRYSRTLTLPSRRATSRRC